MYDIHLLEDIRSFKSGASNIYEIRSRYETIYKIIKNRTKEKIDILNFMLNNNIIDVDFYNELWKRVKSDYKVSILYLMGLVNLD